MTLPELLLGLAWLEVEMSRKELLKLKEAAESLAREHNTPQKAQEILIRIGYLNPNGEVAERYR